MNKPNNPIFSFLISKINNQSIRLKGFIVYIICIVYQNHYEDRSQDVVGPWSHGDCRKGKPNNDLYTPTFCSMGTGGEQVNKCNGGKLYFFQKDDIRVLNIQFEWIYHNIIYFSFRKTTFLKYGFCKKLLRYE